MFTLALAVAISASIMRAVSILAESRFKPQYFTRKCKLPFHDLLKFLLSMHKTSSQCTWNDFLERKGITMSQQALSKARSKFSTKIDALPLGSHTITMYDNVKSSHYQI